MSILKKPIIDPAKSLKIVLNTSKRAYTDFERRFFLSIVEKYKHIINNKKFDSASMKERRCAWNKIAFEYNKHPETNKRITIQLRRLWENTKARKKMANGRGVEQGGGADLHHSTESADSGTTDMTYTTEDTMSTDMSGSATEAKFLESLLAQDQPINDYSYTTMRSEPNRLRLAMQESSSYDPLLTPIVSARMKKIEDSIEQQKIMHQLAKQREALQIEALEEDAKRDREIHELRIRQETELHAQRMRQEEELHQYKVFEYKKFKPDLYQEIEYLEDIE